MVEKNSAEVLDFSTWLLPQCICVSDTCMATEQPEMSRFRHCPPCSLRQDLSLEPRVNLARFPGIRLSLPPQDWNYSVPPCLVLGIKLESVCPQGSALPTDF